MFLNDLILVFQWWFIILLFSIAGLPLTCSIFEKSDDRAYSLSRLISIFSISYIVFLGARLHLFKFSKLAIIISIIIFIIFERLFIAVKRKSLCKIKAVNNDKNVLRYFFIEELAFLVLLIAWAYLRGFHPELNSTEKYMDFGFMNTIINSDYFPVRDIWASGLNINYYYYGQYLGAFLAKLSGIAADYSYNLMMATLFAATFMAVFSLAFAMLRSIKDSKICTSIFGGSMASIMVCLSSNLHYLIYGLIIPKLIELGLFHDAEFLGVEDLSSYVYYFARATRYIGYQPFVSNDRTITEFPIYSYVVSDLHAHVVNLMAVILFLAVAFVYVQRQTEGIEEFKKKFDFRIDPLIIFMGFLLGIFSMCNYWDFAIYMIVSVFFFGYVLWKNYGLSARILVGLIYQSVILLLTRYLVALPMTLGFTKMYSGISVVKYHSEFYQLLVLWGVPLLISIIFVLWLLKKHNIKSKLREEISIKCGSTVEIADIYAIILIICAIGLIYGTEIAYIRDIYEVTSPRANTMFKLGYQAFILFGISSGYVFARIVSSIVKPVKKIIAILLIFLLCLSTLIYVPYSIKAWYGGREYTGINCINYIKDIDGDEDDSPLYDSIEWIRTNTDKDAVVLEVYGDSFTQNCIVSVATGRPTVIGWNSHEWLWRNSYEFFLQRRDVVDNIYSGKDRDNVVSLINEYEIDYIYIGKFEREKYGRKLNEKLIGQIGKLVYENGDVKIYSMRQN